MSVLGVILYGLSIGGISTMMFLRMYMMLTFFTIEFLYINLKIVKNDFEIQKKNRVLLGIIPVLGFLTQYFFAIYAFFVFCVMVILFIKKKKFDQMKKYIISIAISAIAGLLIFPFSIGHMLWSDRGVGSFEESNFVIRTLKYCSLIMRYFGCRWEIFIAFLIIAISVLCIKRKREIEEMSVLFFPTIFFIIIVSFLTEFLELRYVMNILPIIAIMIVTTIDSIFENEKYSFITATVVVTLLLGYGFITETPLYLDKGYNNYIEISRKYKEDDLVYVGYTFFNHMQSMPEFMNYRKTFMIYDDQLERLSQTNELEDKQEFILSINQGMDVEKILTQIKGITGFTQSQLIYKGCDEIEQEIYLMRR